MKEIDKSGTKFFLGALKAAGKCLSAQSKAGNSADLSPICLGSFSSGVFVAPTDPKTLQLINNGSDFPIEVTDVSLLPGAPPSLTIDVPPLPLSIPVGQSVPVSVHFSPTDSVLTSATLRVTSDDPDEGQIDVSVGMLSFLQPLAPPEVRGACLKDLE
ncbi:MAG TPA: hypothetical protein VJ829_03845 [Candidatus Binatia bacterium]|nr:hypothetical protein [Candidatus Binatia bacterium]